MDEDGKNPMDYVLSALSIALENGLSIEDVYFLADGIQYTPDLVEAVTNAAGGFTDVVDGVTDIFPK